MRPRSISVVAFNVALPDPSPKSYRRLLKNLADMRAAYRLSGDRFGLLSSAFKRPNGDMEGDFVTYDQINVSGRWHNLKTGEEATERDKQGLNVPAHLGANRKQFRYRFYVEGHRLIVESRNYEGLFSSRHIDKLLQALISLESVVDEFGDVAVTPVPKKDAVSRILAKQLVKLDIRVTVPNSLSTAEALIRERLESRNAKSERIVVTAKAGTTLVPDDDLKAWAQFASKNGEVEASVKNEGGGPALKLSTRDTPIQKTTTYQIKEETEADAFERAADALHGETSEE